jgi:phage terminase small subunit
MRVSKAKQQQVILNYKANGGNMKKAMIDAGYSESYADKNSKYLLGIIGEEIQNQQNEIKQEKIKDIVEIQEWWTTMMNDENQDPKDRIKCSELLAKAQGAFILKVDAEVQTETTINIELVDDDEC